VTAFRHVRRSGAYFRVCKPEWGDCADTSYSKRFGGRWTPPGEFGALYLCATIEVAAAVARSHHAGRAISLFSLRPSRRPQLQTFNVRPTRCVDVVTTKGIAAAELPSTYPFAVERERCWPAAQRAYETRERGIACRSAAECAAGHWLGEELAIFDNGPLPKASGKRRAFSEWYTDLVPL